MLTFRCLVAYVMLPHYAEIEPSLVLEHELASSLVIHMVLNVTNCIIWPIKLVFSQEKSFSRNLFFPLKLVPSSTSVDHSMFPSHTCVSDQPIHSISATTHLPTVSTEFSPPFNLCDTVVPPDKFPDLVHSDPPLSSVPDPIPNTSLPLRHSSRVHTPPTYLRDYHYNLVSTSVLASASLISSNDSIASSFGILYPLSSTLSYDKLSTPHKDFSIALTIHKEPESYA